MPELYLYPIADSYLLVAAITAVLLALLALRPSGGRLSNHRRWALLALRAGVIALLVIAMLRPTIVYTEIRKQPATLVMMVDRSKSMSVGDGVGGATRWQELQQCLADATPALARLAKDFEIKAYAFDAQVQAVPVEGGNLLLEQSPDGPQTAIGASLDDVLRLEAGKRLLGVVLFSDGAQRAIAPRDLPPQTAAARLKHLGVPLFTVPFGQARGLGQVQDVALRELIVGEAVFVKNELVVGGQVRADGYVNRELTVRLLFETAPGKMEVVAQQTVRATADGQLLPVRFTYVPETPGEFKLTLEAVPQPGELVTTNNQLSTFVTVLKGGLNVLYLEGGLRVEQRFLRRALDAAQEIKVDFVRLDPRRPETRPGDFPERFKPGKYDVYIIGDLDSKAFQPGELSDLAEAVGRGAGLIMLGGIHSFGPGGYADTPLARVLPVRMEASERQQLDAPVRRDVHLPGPVPMQPTSIGLLRYVLSLAASREETLTTWKRLPPLDGANLFQSAGLAPGAEVWIDDGKNHPLLVAHQYGDGRVLAFAGDSTWRWVLNGFGSAHSRFWLQVVLWLARKDQPTEGAVHIKLANRRFAPGQRVEFTLETESPTREKLADVDYQVRVQLPRKPDSPEPQYEPVRTVAQGTQAIGSFRNTATAGDYAIEVTAARQGQPLGSARARFLVFEQDIELDNAAADVGLLQNLAAITGGEMIAPEQLAELIDRLANQPENLEIPQETKLTFWDRWSFFLTLVGLLSVEWYLRKRWGLV